MNNSIPLTSMSQLIFIQDLATFLAVFGATVDGTLTQWSISGLEHTGIAGSHNNYEADSSPNYADLNQYGSNVELVISQFKNVCLE